LKRSGRERAVRSGLTADLPFAARLPVPRGVSAGIFQTCQYIGAINATVMIGIFYRAA
jgi:hypothetical protein